MGTTRCTFTPAPAKGFLAAMTLGFALVGCGQSEAELSADLADEAAPSLAVDDRPECDAEVTANILGAGLAQLDHSPSQSPVDLAARSVAVVRGRLQAAEPVTMDRVEGTRLIVEGTTRWTGQDQGRSISDLWIPALDVPEIEVSADPRLAVDVLAFVEREIGPIGAAAVWPDGLWVACDGADRPGGNRAYPVLVEPSAPGWQPLLDQGVTLDLLAASG